MTKTIALLPGDGIGPEITAPTRRAARQARRLRVRGAPVRRRLDRRPRHRPHRRGARRLQAGRRGPARRRRRPQVGHHRPDEPRPEQGLLGLRKGLGLFANLRPVRAVAGALDASPLKRERIEGTDLLVVRELTGGIYFGDEGRDGRHAPTTPASTRVEEIERIARVGVPAPRDARVTSVDKANVLETSRLWREVVARVHAAEFPERRARAPARRQRRDAADLAARRTST